MLSHVLFLIAQSLMFRLFSCPVLKPQPVTGYPAGEDHRMYAISSLALSLPVRFSLLTKGYFFMNVIVVKAWFYHHVDVASLSVESTLTISPVQTFSVGHSRP